MTPEVLTIGRISVDLYPEQIGVPLAEVRTFRKMLGCADEMPSLAEVEEQLCAA